MLDILTGLDKLILFSLPLASGVTVFPGAMVTVNEDGEVILATASANKPWYLCISDSEEPMVKAAGTVGLILGDVRYKTDNFDTGSYSVGTPLTIAAGGKLKPAGASDVIVGYIEQIVSSSPTVAIVRGF